MAVLAEYLSNRGLSDHAVAGLIGLLGIAGQMVKTWENESGLQMLKVNNILIN